MKRSDAFTTFRTFLKKPDTFFSDPLHCDTLTIDVSCARLPTNALTYAQHLSDTWNLEAHFAHLHTSNTLNVTEHRSVNHLQLRQDDTTRLYATERQRLYLWVQSIHTQKRITTVVQLGIGGSQLGPEAIYRALSAHARLLAIPQKMNGLFIPAVDPLSFQTKMEGIAPESTLFLLASKSGTTHELHATLAVLKEWWVAKGYPLSSLRDHCVTLTCRETPLDCATIATESFYIDAAIGGRFCSTSVLGLCMLALCFGTTWTDQLLAGARRQDTNSSLPSFTKNMALLAAWETIWRVNVEGLTTRCLISYGYGTDFFPYHVQQLSCESNGKAVSIHNTALDYETGPLLIPTIGTHAQHSFFQHIHQSKQITPIEIIGCPIDYPHSPACYEAYRILNLHRDAQSFVLTHGNHDVALYQYIPGNRPVTNIRLADYSPYAIGQLLSFYENKTVYEGFIWQINSFDQEGVQLGKQWVNTALSTQTPTQHHPDKDNQTP